MLFFSTFHQTIVTRGMDQRAAHSSGNVNYNYRHLTVENMRFEIFLNPMLFFDWITLHFYLTIPRICFCPNILLHSVILDPFLDTITSDNDGLRPQWVQQHG